MNKQIDGSLNPTPLYMAIPCITHHMQTVGMKTCHWAAFLSTIPVTFETLTTSKQATHALQIASYSNTNQVANGMNVNKLVAFIFSLAGISNSLSFLKNKLSLISDISSQKLDSRSQLSITNFTTFASQFQQLKLASKLS